MWTRAIMSRGHEWPSMPPDIDVVTKRKEG